MNGLPAYQAAIWEPDDLVEVRCLPVPGARWWLPASELAGDKTSHRLLRANARDKSIYAGINPRSGPGGTAHDVALARCLFVDFDGGVTPEDAIKILANADLPAPTVMVFSGNGTHCYWRLGQAITDLAVWTGLQKALIALLKTDPVIHDPPRIMRFPGTMNIKRGRMCELVACDPNRRCALREFPAATPAVGAGAVAGFGTGRRAWISDPSSLRGGGSASGMLGLSRATRLFLQSGAAEGGRNNRIFAAACDMAGCGLTQTEAHGLLLAAIGRCSPPFTETEALAAIRSAYSKARISARPPARGQGSFRIPVSHSGGVND